MTLDQVLHTELHKALCRNLDFAPQPEDLPATHAVMMEDLKRYGLTDADADRIQKAFWTLGPTAQRFPTPAMVIRALPSHPRLEPPGHGVINREGLKKFADIARQMLDAPKGKEQSDA